MKLWVEAPDPDSAGMAVRMKVAEVKARVNRQIASRGARAVVKLRSAELEVLRGQRGGKVYRKYPYSSTYTASAPGEPPARRTGNLRMHWSGDVKTLGSTVRIELRSGEHYAKYLEFGTRKMARRPFVNRIAKKAEPDIRAIFSEPYV